MNYLDCFPDYDRELIKIDGFRDTSWRNDACPSISRGLIQIFCNYADPKKREIKDSSLYHCILWSTEETKDETIIYYETNKELATDNISDVLDFIKQNEGDYDETTN